MNKNTNFATGLMMGLMLFGVILMLFGQNDTKWTGLADLLFAGFFFLKY